MKRSRKKVPAVNELWHAIGLALAVLSLANCFPQAKKESKVVGRIRGVPLSVYAVDSARGQAIFAIAGERHRLEEGIRSNDAVAMAAVYARDAFFFPPGGDSVGGREAIIRSFERPARDYEIVHVIHELDVHGDVAYEIGRWIQRTRNDSTAIGGGGYSWIWRRQPDNRWTIWREVWNDGPAVPATSIGQATPARPFGTLREQAEAQQRWLAARMATVLPAIMRKYAVDMWVIPMREYNEDPVFTSIVSPTTFAARRRTIYVFSMRGDSVERIALGGSSQGGVYTAIRSTQAASGPAGGTTQRNAELWGEEQWLALKKVIEERNPRNIAVNVSRVFAFSDGLSAGEMEGMREALGEKWTSRFVSHDGLALDLITTRLPEEAAFYRRMQELVWALIDTAFSNTVITPGVTRTDDVVWWFRQRVNDLGLGSWFQPSVSIQRRGALDDNLGPNPVIQRGDVLHCDFGIVALRLATDTQHMGYVLRDGETAPPAGLVAALRNGNRLQDIVMEEVKTGRTGNEVLKSSLARMRAAGIDGTVYTHPIGVHGHGAGPLIGLWDYQEGVPGRGDAKIIPSMWFSIELQATSPVPEWNGQRVRMALEEDMTIDAKGANAWALRRQTEFHLIR